MRNYFSQSKWEQIILEELKEERPILYSGEMSDEEAGHAFVLDGYDGNGFYHFNWGWKGSGVNPNYGNESYFKLTSLTPKTGNTTSDYTYNQSMVCQISPQTIGEFECVFYADKFTVNNFSLGNSLKVSFNNLTCYVTSANSFDTPFNGGIGVRFVNAFTNKGKVWYDEISMKSGWFRESQDLSLTISATSLPDGTYYLYPCVITGVSNGMVQNRTDIRTVNTQYDYYLATIKNGKVTFTLKGTPTPDVSITSVTCDNTNLNELTHDDKLILNAKYKNMGAKLALKSRLSICTKNSEGKLTVKYNSKEQSKQVAYNEEVSFKHEFSLTNVPYGTYYATVMYYKDWIDTPNWYYSLSSSNQYEIEVSEDGVEITETNFPDATFRSILLQTDQGKDGKFSKSEINGIKYLLVGSKEISSLKGIEHFKALTVLSCSNNQLTSLDVSNLTELTILYCSVNELTTLDVSRNTKLKELNCALNKIKGPAMDNLINSLPYNTTAEYYDFSVLAYDNTFDENVCTKEQAAAAKAKGWMPKYYDGTDWLEYEGSDDVSAINGIKMDAIKKDTPVYNLRGQRLTAPQKGINIIGGRKVVVK